jgi:hypothetical protein
MFRKKTVPAPVIIATNESRMSTISELPGTKSAPQHCLIALIRYWTAALCAAHHVRYILVIHILCGFFDLASRPDPMEMPVNPGVAACLAELRAAQRDSAAAPALGALLDAIASCVCDVWYSIGFCGA